MSLNQFFDPAFVTIKQSNEDYQPDTAVNEDNLIVNNKSMQKTKKVTAVKVNEQDLPFKCEQCFRSFKSPLGNQSTLSKSL